MLFIYGINSYSEQHVGVQMARLTITKAIELSSVGRTQFYNKYIKEGLISVSESNGKKYIESSELIRVFGELKDSDSPVQTETDSIESSVLVRTLREQLKKSEEREQHYREHIDALTLRLEAPTPDAAIKRQSRISKWWYGLD